MNVESFLKSPAAVGMAAAYAAQRIADEDSGKRPRFAPDFTYRATDVMEFAEREARSHNHLCIGTEHILLGLIYDKSSVAGHILNQFGVTFDGARKHVLEIVRVEENPVENIALGPLALKVVRHAREYSQKRNGKYVGPEHLGYGLTLVDGVGTRVLTMMGVGLREYRERIDSFLA